VGFVVGKVALGQVSLPSSSVLSYQYHFIVVLHTHISFRVEQYARYWQQFRDVVSPHRNLQSTSREGMDKIIFTVPK
jgi:hypothetical protein